FSGAADITSQVGPFVWSSTQQQVVTVDNNGLATAVAPGQGSVFASIGNFPGIPNGPVTSQATSFTTCLVDSIRVHAQGAPDTSVTAAIGDSKPLVADVVDAGGVTLANVPLTYTGTQPVVATVAGSAAL